MTWLAMDQLYEWLLAISLTADGTFIFSHEIRLNQMWTQSKKAAPNRG